MTRVMLVDDDLELLEIYQKIFNINGFDVVACENGDKALNMIEKMKISVVVSDIIMPKMDGMELLKKIKKMSPETEVIMLTAEGSISGAVEAVKEGAFSYLVKPADVEELISNIKKAAELSSTKVENKTLKNRLEILSRGTEFIGISHIAEELRQKAQLVGGTDSAVLITGETGTGKEILANMIHRCSGRADNPFVCVNCGALNENLIESELFGSEKGAYTGAEKQKKGRFEIADGGTIFFDEIGEMSLNMQTRLLRVLQEKTFERVGGYETVKSDFRLIAATNRNLKQEVEAGRFRKDLYYRINIIPIEIPPLRERSEDIPILCQTFLELYSREMNKPLPVMDEEMLKTLQHYEWHGNVRELRNLMERIVVLSGDGPVDIDVLPEEIKDMFDKGKSDDTLRSHTKAFEKEYIIKIMKKYHGNVAKAAEEMQIARKNLYRKLNEYDIDYRNHDL